MDNRTPLLILSVIAVSLLSANAFAESMIRIGCVGEAEGAKVFINGEFADNCPANLFIEPGRKRIRVVQSLGEDYERVFETELVLRADSPKRVNVELSQPRLTAEAKRARADRTLSEARDGNIEAMRRMASFYREGSGVEKNIAKAEGWDNKARSAELASEADAVRQRAERGSVDAMRELAGLYEEGRGVDRDTEKAARWRRKAEESEADLTLIRAKSGEVEAMKAMSERYAEGKGVEKDQSKSEEWASRADEITQASLNEKKATERRQQARKELDYL
ncbi:MAG: tetratricopeptide repeat protein, partial [Oleiphilaceae bacterium]|nr:tetratricopeptide repeat protein [Oleiphilaceae bacterium]